MSEDEILEIIKEHIDNEMTDKTVKLDTIIYLDEAIKELYNMYQKEKEKNKILRKIISSVREETRLVRFSLGKPYNTPKKEIFFKFINIQNLLKGNYPFLSTDQYIDDLLRINEFIKR